MTKGERVRLVRNELGLTLDKFGEKLGVKKNTLSAIEIGRNGLTDQMAKSICREYRVNYFWLTEGSGEMFIGLPDTLIDEIAIEYDLDDFEKNMIIEYLKLSKEQRAVLKQYIKNITKKDPN